MKNFKPVAFVFVLFLFTLSDGFSQQRKTLVWNTNYAGLIKQAARQKKPVLLFFHGSDWSLPCIKMQKEVFDNNQFIQFAAERILFLNVDFPKKNILSDSQLKHNNKLKKQFGLSADFSQGIPQVVIIDKSEKVLYQEMGYDSEGPQKLMDKIRSAIKKTRE